MGRLLSVDFGHARMGLAISDPTKLIASPLRTIKGSKDPKAAASFLFSDIKQEMEKGLEAIVVGLPLKMNGQESERSQEVRAFIEHLQGLTTIPVIPFDERLTSVQAERSMKEGSLNRKQRAQAVDSISSIILLQCYLDSLRSSL